MLSTYMIFSTFTVCRHPGVITVGRGQCSSMTGDVIPVMSVVFRFKELTVESGFRNPDVFLTTEAMEGHVTNSEVE